MRIVDATGRLVNELHRPGQDVTCLAFSPDGRELLTGTKSGSLWVWDLAKRTCSRMYTNAEPKVDRVTWLGKDRVASLGLDVVNRHGDNMFECSPLNCNGHYHTVTVNRYCLLDHLETAVHFARHWSVGTYDAQGAYMVRLSRGPISSSTPCANAWPKGEP